MNSKIADRPVANHANGAHEGDGGAVGLRGRIVALLAEGLEPADAADAALAAASPEELRDFARDHARWEAVRILRLRTVQVERKVQSTVREGGSFSIALRSLAREPVALPTGVIVTFDTMTVEQHESRANWLGAQAAGLRLTAKLHTDIAKLLRSEGAVCIAKLRAAAKRRARELQSAAEVAA